MRTFYYLVVGIGVLGFALVAVPGALNLLLEDVLRLLGAYTRGWIGSITWAAALIAIPIAGQYGDRLFRRDPRSRVRHDRRARPRATASSSPSGLQFESPVVLVVLFALANACQGAAFTQVGPTISAVVPYRMRAQAFALVGVYIFLMGGFFGGLIAGAFSDAYGERTALTIIVPPAALARRAARS